MRQTRRHPSIVPICRIKALLRCASINIANTRKKYKRIWSRVISANKSKLKRMVRACAIFSLQERGRSCCLSQTGQLLTQYSHQLFHASLVGRNAFTVMFVQKMEQNFVSQGWLYVTDASMCIHQKFLLATSKINAIIYSYCKHCNRLYYIIHTASQQFVKDKMIYFQKRLKTFPEYERDFQGRL